MPRELKLDWRDDLTADVRALELDGTGLHVARVEIAINSHASSGSKRGMIRRAFQDVPAGLGYYFVALRSNHGRPMAIGRGTSLEAFGRRVADVGFTPDLFFIVRADRDQYISWADEGRLPVFPYTAFND